MRIQLFSGKGGVGKTTTAAATAVAAADQGLSVLSLSTDPAHSLADVYDMKLGDAPELVVKDLWAVQIDSQRRLEENWTEIQQYLLELMNWSGVGGIEAEELTTVPGLDELFALADIKDYADSNQFDLIVVDCAPTADTIRLLSFPDALAWVMDRIFPASRRLARLARPVWNRIPNLPDIADDEVFSMLERLYERLESVRTLLSDHETASVRLVMNADRLVLAESQRLYTYLSLFGYRVDAAIVNKLIPESVEDPYFLGWKESQARCLKEIDASFAPLTVLRSRLFEAEVIGVEALRQYAGELYGDRDPLEVITTDDPIQVRQVGDGFVVSILLPFVGDGEVGVVRKDEQLFVTVGPYKRIMLLPKSLLRRDIVDVAMVRNRLEIRFESVDAETA